MAKASGIILDSNVWIAYLHAEDSQHTKALAALDALTEPVIVPEYVLAEVATVLKQKGQHARGRAFVREVTDSGGSALLVLDEQMVRTVSRLFTDRNDKLSFVDTVLLALSTHYRIVTFDTALKRAIKAR